MAFNGYEIQLNAYIVFTKYRKCIPYFKLDNIQVI